MVLRAHFRLQALHVFTSCPRLRTGAPVASSRHCHAADERAAQPGFAPMKLIATKRPPSEKLDRLQYLRDDGSSCECAMPRQGVLPHDLIHFVVESALALRNGFLSLVARGGNAVFVMECTHDRNNREVEIQAVQAEAIVEALQTQLWAGDFDREAFVYGAQMAAQSRGVPAPELRMSMSSSHAAAVAEQRTACRCTPAPGTDLRLNAAATRAGFGIAAAAAYVKPCARNQINVMPRARQFDRQRRQRRWRDRRPPARGLLQQFKAGRAAAIDRYGSRAPPARGVGGASSRGAAADHEVEQSDRILPPVHMRWNCAARCSRQQKQAR
jgi:hypothetical protein